MAGTKAFEFDAQDLYNLLVHYTDGQVPLHGEVREVGRNPFLDRVIGFFVESNEWDEQDLGVPLQIRYSESHKVATWTEGQGDVKWGTPNETPRHQM